MVLPRTSFAVAAAIRFDKTKNAAFPEFLKHKIQIGTPPILAGILVGQAGGFSGKLPGTLSRNQDSNICPPMPRLFPPLPRLKRNV